MGSYASAAERQSSFTSQTSSQPGSFYDPLAAASRPASFVSASASSFPASRLNSVTGGSRPDAAHTVIEMPSSDEAQLQAPDVGNGVLSAIPPSQRHGWR